MQEILGEAEELEPAFNEIKSLSGQIISFLLEVHEPSANNLRSKLDQLADNYNS